jgi:4-aminobutyrate aminotransferase-like enzyme
MKEKKTTLVLWHTFTSEELSDKAQALATNIIQHADLEIEKKQAVDSFKDRLEAMEAMTWVLSQHVRERGMNQAVECVVQFHTPAISKKRTVRLDTGEVVREETMTSAECQENLFSTEPIETAEAQKASA